jgi:hypothetical protein
MLFAVPGQAAWFHDRARAGQAGQLAPHAGFGPLASLNLKFFFYFVLV